MGSCDSRRQGAQSRQAHFPGDRRLHHWLRHRRNIRARPRPGVAPNTHRPRAVRPCARPKWRNRTLGQENCYDRQRRTMTKALDQSAGTASSWNTVIARATQAGPPLLFGFRLWALVCLALYVAFWLQLDNPFWAGYTAATVCQEIKPRHDDWGRERSGEGGAGGTCSFSSNSSPFSGPPSTIERHLPGSACRILLVSTPLGNHWRHAHRDRLRTAQA